MNELASSMDERDVESKYRYSDDLAAITNAENMDRLSIPESITMTKLAAVGILDTAGSGDQVGVSGCIIHSSI